jgi:hypothetical protein
MRVPVTPAVAAARVDDAAGKARGETEQNERNKKTTHGDPFALGVTPP